MEDSGSISEVHTWNQLLEEGAHLREGVIVLFQKNNGIHNHTYDIRGFYSTSIILKEKEEMLNMFIEFISKKIFHYAKLRHKFHWIC